VETSDLQGRDGSLNGVLWDSWTEVNRIFTILTNLRIEEITLDEKKEN